MKMRSNLFIRKNRQIKNRGTVQAPESGLINILKKNKVNFISTLPCEKIKGLLHRITGEFFHVPLTREEEGVGISAGIALAGKRPAIFVQSSGVGNMINALLSLTGFYELPLAVFVSQRGIYKEKIAAQLPMGQHLPEFERCRYHTRSSAMMILPDRKNFPAYTETANARIF
jgi:sulfopyruvate decarboxylase alpha subunit